MQPALFFLAGTSCDKICLVYLDEMGGIAIPMSKVFTMFMSFPMASLALLGMSGFGAESLCSTPFPWWTINLHRKSFPHWRHCWPALDMSKL